MMRGDAVYDDGMLRIAWVGSPAVLAIAGEIDEATYPGLLGALKEVADEPGDVHVCLAGVDYCDLAGLRAIVMLTGSDGQRHDVDGRHGRRVVLHEVPSQLQTVLRIVGWDTVPGLALLDGPKASSQPWADATTEAGLRAGGRG
jgi:anti-anti-sigma regulatory factor